MKYLSAALAAARCDEDTARCDEDTARAILDLYLEWTREAAEAKSAALLTSCKREHVEEDEEKIPLAEALGYEVVKKEEVVSEEE